MFKVRDLVPGDMSSAVRLLELCRNAADSKPVDIAKFVADSSAGAPAIVAVAENEVVGLVSSQITPQDLMQSISRTSASITSQIAQQFADESQRFGRA